MVLLTSCASSSPQLDYYSARNIDLSAQNTTFWRANTNTIWQQLQHTSIPTLQTALSGSTVAYNTAWLSLALFSKRDSNNTPVLINELIHWRKNNPDHPANALFPDDDHLMALNKTPPPSHIALLLPLKGPFGEQGKAIRDGFLKAYYASSLKNQFHQTISFYDTSDSFNVRDVYKKALALGADRVVGPLTKDEVQDISHHANSSVMTLALNYTDNHLPAHFYEFGLSSTDEAEQAANKAYSAGGQRAIVIAPLSPSGQKTARFLIGRWESLNGKIADTYYFANNVNFSADIAHLMQGGPAEEDRNKMHADNNNALPGPERRQDFDVIFLIASQQNARTIVPLLKYYHAGNVPIYATSEIYSHPIAPQKDMDLNGVHFPDIPFLLKDTHSSEGATPEYRRLYAVGLDAYLLSHELPRLEALSNFPLYASTGALTLRNQHIYRRLPWMEIHAGRT